MLPTQAGQDVLGAVKRKQAQRKSEEAAAEAIRKAERQKSIELMRPLRAAWDEVKSLRCSDAVTIPNAKILADLDWTPEGSEIMLHLRAVGDDVGVNITAEFRGQGAERKLCLYDEGIKGVISPGDAMVRIIDYAAYVAAEEE